jgi:hypothetical protein
VHAALDVVDEMCEVGMTLSIEVLDSILHASEESYDFNLVGCLISFSSPILCDICCALFSTC